MRLSATSFTRRVLPSVAIACAAGWALWLAPLQRPRTVLPNVTATSLRFSPDSRFLAALDDGSVRIFRAADGSQLYRFNVVDDDTVDEVVAIAFSPDGNSAAVLTLDGIVATWCLATGKELARHVTDVNVGVRAWEQSIRYGKGGRLMVFDSGGIYQAPPLVRWVDVATGKDAIRATLDGMPALQDLSEERQLFFTDAHVIVLDAKRAWCFDIITGKKLADIKNALSREVEFSADGTTFAHLSFPSWDCAVFQADTGEWTRFADLADCNSIALTADGEWLAACKTRPDWNAAWYAQWMWSSACVHVKHLPDGAHAGSFGVGDRAIFSPDGRTLAVGWDASLIEVVDPDVQLWDFPPRRPWAWILGGAGATGASVYLLLVWQSRRRRA